MINVKINKYTFEVIFEKDGDNVFFKPNDEGKALFGSVDHRVNKIYVHSELPTDRQKQTLIHELTHAFIAAYGFEFVDINSEILCDFVGLYAEDIIKEANRILKEINKEEE